MTKDELARLRLAAGETRMCVVCGMTRPASEGMEAPGAGCWVPDACTWDMTPQEAADHWRELAHDRATRIADLQAERDALKAALVEVAQAARRKALKEAAAVAPGFPVQKALESLTQCEQAYANGVAAYQNRIRALMTE